MCQTLYPQLSMLTHLIIVDEETEIRNPFIEHLQKSGNVLSKVLCNSVLSPQ